MATATDTIVAFKRFHFYGVALNEGHIGATPANWNPYYQVPAGRYAEITIPRYDGAGDAGGLVIGGKQGEEVNQLGNTTYSFGSGYVIQNGIIQLPEVGAPILMPLVILEAGEMVGRSGNSTVTNYRLYFTVKEYNIP